MRKITAIQIAIIFILGLTPILWLREGYIISNGDNIPASLNAAKTFSSSFNTWSPDFLGYASPTPSYLLNTYFAAYLGDLGLSVGAIQIFFQILLYMGAGLSMFYFTQKIYPNHEFASFFASLFYMLNFFILMSRFNLGFAWTYAFLPLILALFVISVEAACRQDKKRANLGIIGFALVSIVPFSIASVNPANIALFLISLAVMAVYLLVKYRSALLPYSVTLGKLGLATFLVNIWWLLPMINTFFISPQSLGASVNVSSWSWTHQRASFINMFWLNGTWGWNSYYIPSSLLSWYANPLVAILMFVPFALAGVALLFKSNKSRFNAFVALCILVFVFLGTGLHYSDNYYFSWLSWLGSALYNYVPLMSMFREPVSKFTLIIIPFLALLIGFTADRLIKMDLHFRPKITKSLKIVFAVFIIGTFIISALPIFKIPANFADTKTDNIPSSYIQIPQYWFQATDWINNQPGDWKVLLTPLDDFYEMPFTWGYFGTDVLLERLFDKPIVSSSALDGYISNPEPAADIAQIRRAVKFNYTDEFQALLNLLNIKYIVQRNDVDNNMTGRNLKSPEEMQTFFGEQPYLKLVERFGQLDIYEYTQAKPSIYALSPSTLQETDLYINRTLILNQTWTQTDFERQSNDTSETEYSQTNGANASSSWITFNSPLLPASPETSYLIDSNFTGRNIFSADTKVAEYSENLTLVTNSSIGIITMKDPFDGYNINQRFEPQGPDTKFFQIQIWANESSRSTLNLDNINIVGTMSILSMTGIDKIYQDIEQSQNILQIKSVDLTKAVVAVNSTQPFILATTQSLDKDWVATVNSVQVSPIPTYLGLKGFMINQTGQFDVTLDYEPQQWFSYSLIVSGVTVLFLCIAVLYLQRINLKEAYQRIRKPKL